MTLTREQAIREFRKMWEWIATESVRRKRKVDKNEYFDENGIEHIRNKCFLCEYTLGNNMVYAVCPIDFNGNDCVHSLTSPYGKWIVTPCDNYIEASALAREIARLPEKKWVL